MLRVLLPVLILLAFLGLGIAIDRTFLVPEKVVTVTKSLTTTVRVVSSQLCIRIDHNYTLRMPKDYTAKLVLPPDSVFVKSFVVPRPSYMVIELRSNSNIQPMLSIDLGGTATIIVLSNPTLHVNNTKFYLVPVDHGIVSVILRNESSKPISLHIAVHICSDEECLQMLRRLS